MDAATEAERREKRPGAIARAGAALIRRGLQLRIVRAVLLHMERHGPILADGVTYRALFSVFAAVLLGFSAAALWLTSDDVAWNAVVSAIDSAVPGLIKERPDGPGLIDPSEIRAPAGLSITGIVSLVGLIGAALGAIGSLRVAMRSIAGTVSDDVAPPLVILRNLSLAAIIAAAFVGSAALTFAGRAVLRWAGGLLGLPEDSPVLFWSVRLISLVIVFALNTVLIAAAFRALAGVRARARALWSGAMIGGAGLLVLQELSGLFVGGARANPLLASFASLLALLIWLNLSTQVILLASAYIVTAAAEDEDRVANRYGAQTLAEHRLRRAEQDAQIATAELRSAQQAVEDERP
ncbi:MULTISPECIES: YihY/virulence factor BrkB family protein [Microbacterium]|uniref:YihY/virulence factor BrkB family protein n=1 Tax=Microbacterium TaxID=33882 RepID=UPI00217DF598|nr:MULTISPECIES: YihY/virulence factor BrkB family protein [Microbacterium]UWF78269.1 YihY/virulence factor BrkB family protein [Microbacterium neungamense]WCM56443.1 YihY/virulence factor BrkB family protein [Microbacterium sp. EF45047]